MLLKTIFKGLALCIAIIVVIATISGYLFFKKLSQQLPDTQKLNAVQYQTPLNIYSSNAQLIAQYGEKKRIPITIAEVPEQLIQAFIAVEDDRFYEHPGVDYQGLLRATIQLILTGKKKQGGSTITMQVVRNFLLTPEKTYTRKIKEIILAFKIERELSKQQILELYLNKIFLGHHAYGIAAAAQTYYGKQLSELTLAEQAMLAGLPKAPSQTNPISNGTKARVRRNFVLSRMRELNYISATDFSTASNMPLTAKSHHVNNNLSAQYIAEMVRNEIFQLYGEQAYTSGLKVFTTLDAALQNAANSALVNSLHKYDQRHGYRIKAKTAKQKVTDLDHFRSIGDTLPAFVEDVTKKHITAQLKDNTKIEITWDNIKWARLFKNRNRIGPVLKSAKQIINQGDIIRVRKLSNDTWSLCQIPEAEGALVSLNPLDGAILALTGGFDFQRSKYNRVTQSKRQPGSGFKPIIYTTALENGYTAASLINDAPVVIDDPSRESEWRPENYSHKFFGPTSLRTGLRKSRNLISIRLLRSLGIEKVISSAERFGFQQQQLPHSLSLALGSGYANPLQMARMYAVFANGGYLIEPYFIERIEDAKGDIIFQAKPTLACPDCTDNMLVNAHYAPRIISPRINFLMNSLLRDVVRRGTATRAKSLGRGDLAGKTGTTNDQKDAWFNGFSPDLVASAWVGLDNSKPLGRRETGGKAALPMWIAYMKTALPKISQETELKPPTGIKRAFIDPTSGQLAATGNSKGIWEYFRAEYAPTEFTPTLTSTTNDTQIEEPEEALF